MGTRRERRTGTALRRALARGAAAALGLALGACTSPPVGPPAPAAATREASTAEASTAEADSRGAAITAGRLALPVTRVAGLSVDGRPLELRSLGAGPRTVFVLASIHGDEGLGTPLVEAVWEHLLRHPALLDGLRVVLLPVANPDGLRAGRRANARGVDLNRNFPASNRRTAPARGDGELPLSEPESRLIHDTILAQGPSLVLTLHQTRRDLPVGFIDYDGPAGDVARAITEHSDFTLKRLGAKPGSLGSWVGIDLGVPILTIELSHEADALDAEQRWARLSPTVLEPLRWLREADPRPGNAP